MGTVATKTGQALGGFRAELVHRFLPGCSNCRAPHPLAMKRPPADTEHCPACGHPSGQPGDQLVEGGALGLPQPLLFVANLLGRIGHGLQNLARKVDP